MKKRKSVGLLLGMRGRVKALRVKEVTNVTAVTSDMLLRGWITYCSRVTLYCKEPVSDIIRLSGFRVPGPMRIGSGLDDLMSYGKGLKHSKQFSEVTPL